MKKIILALTLALTSSSAVLACTPQELQAKVAQLTAKIQTLATTNPQKVTEVTVSALVLNVARRSSFSGFDHQAGTKPQRIDASARFPSTSTTVSMICVGQTLKFDSIFAGVDTSEYIRWTSAQV